MVGSSTELHVSRGGQSPTPVQLVNWPLFQDGLRAWCMAIVLTGTAVVAGYASQSTAMGCLVAAALAVSAWRLWIPVRFEFSSKGITQTILGRQRRIPWSEFARYEIRRRGVLLLAESETSLLAACRSLFVRWNHHREELLELVDFFIKLRPESHPATTRTYHPK